MSGFGDRRRAMLKDFATLADGKAIMEGLGLKLVNIRVDDLGEAKEEGVGASCVAAVVFGMGS